MGKSAIWNEYTSRRLPRCSLPCGKHSKILTNEYERRQGKDLIKKEETELMTEQIQIQIEDLLDEASDTIMRYMEFGSQDDKDGAVKLLEKIVKVLKSIK